MSAVRKLAGRVQRRTFKVLREGPWPLPQLYHATVSDGLRRERRAVTAGHRAFSRATVSAGSEYGVRRHVHMLEKGLTMRPLRTSFAHDYIEDTVSGLARVVASERVMPDELSWMRAVTDQFFDATQESTAPAVVRARAAYRALDWPVARDDSRGPRSPQPSDSVVSIAALTELAHRRSSVRWFADVPVERTVVEAALAVAAEAPTACNRQPYVYRIFDDPELARRVAAVPLGTTGYASNIRSIAVLVGDLSAFADERDRHLIYIDGCLSAMSFVLGLESQGVSSCCINWPDLADRDRAMAKLLGLKTHERVVMLIAYGYAAEGTLSPSSAKKGIRSLRRYNEDPDG